MIKPIGWETAGTTEFGDNPELSTRLISLIIQGKKTATCGALRDYHAEGITAPVPGQRELILDHLGNPVAGLAYTEVTIRRFRDVPEDFALAESEGGFHDWTEGHRAYFARNGGFSPDMLLVCERFILVEQFDGPNGASAAQ